MRDYTSTTAKHLQQFCVAVIDPRAARLTRQPSRSLPTKQTSQHFAME
jgi:hypothetical protein